MKYACEICGQEFNQENACAEHEKICKQAHAPGLETAAALNKVFVAAEEARIAVVTNGGSVRCFIRSATYEPKSQTVILKTH